VAAHHGRDRGEVGRAAGGGVEDGRDLAEVVGPRMPGVTIASTLASTSPALSKWWTAPRGMTSACPGRRRSACPRPSKSGRPRARRSSPRSRRGCERPRPSRAAIGVIREAVGEMEAAWAEQLGAARFAELRNLLLELNQPG
jgi:hypothetical protein